MGFKDFFKNLGENIHTKAGDAELKIKAASPEILLVGGLVCMAGAVVTGIMAAKKHDQVIADHEDRLAEAKVKTIVKGDVDDSGEGTTEVVEVSDKEVARKVRRVYCRTAANMVKLYAPTVALMGLSTACFVGMHNIQAGRIAGLSGAYTGIKEMFDKYQERNIELNGEESHQMCKYGWHEEEVTDENGNVTKKKVVNTPKDLEQMKNEGRDYWMEDLPVLSVNTSYRFKGNYTCDSLLLESAEAMINRYISTRGWATINDAFECLGMEKTIEGNYIGWVRGCGPDASFGWKSPINNRFLAGLPKEPVVLNFNVHGNIVKISNERERLISTAIAKNVGKETC